MFSSPQVLRRGVEPGAVGRTDEQPAALAEVAVGRAREVTRCRAVEVHEYSLSVRSIGYQRRVVPVRLVPGERRFLKLRLEPRAICLSGSIVPTDSEERRVHQGA